VATRGLVLLLWGLSHLATTRPTH